MLFYAWGIKVVTYTANSNNKVVVAYCAFGQNSVAKFVKKWCESNCFIALVDVTKGTKLKVIMMFCGMGRVKYAI